MLQQQQDLGSPDVVSLRKGLGTSDGRTEGCLHSELLAIRTRSSSLLFFPPFISLFAATVVDLRVRGWVTFIVSREI